MATTLVIRVDLTDDQEKAVAWKVKTANDDRAAQNPPVAPYATPTEFVVYEASTWMNAYLQQWKDAQRQVLSTAVDTATKEQLDQIAEILNAPLPMGDAPPATLLGRMSRFFGME